MSDNKVVSYSSFKDFLIDVSRPYYGWLIALCLVGVFVSLLNVSEPYVLKILLDGAAAAKQGEYLKSCLIPGIILITLAFGMTFIWRFYNYIMLRTMPGMRAEMVRITTEYLRGQSYSYFQNNLSGAISAKISDLTGNIHDIVNTIFNISRQIITIVLAIGMVSIVNYYFVVIFLIMAIIFMALSLYCAIRIRPFAQSFAEARSLYIGNIVDCFSNVLNMLIFAREKYEAKYLANNIDIAVEKDKSMQFRNMLHATLLGVISWGLNASCILTLLYLGDKGLISVGDFAFIFFISFTVINNIWLIADNLLTVGEKLGVCEQAIQTIYTKYTQKSLPYDHKIIVTKGELSVNNIVFGYEPGKQAIDNVSMSIAGGMKVGLVGYSGAGKSTIVQLITRLFDIDSGEILIDGQNIKDINRQRLRENIAFIPQAPSLFHRSVYDNILYGRVTATPEEIKDAAKKACAHEFISKLPNGYDTVVGERGVKLSGGQQQRISIARAILKDAPILILDEATSSLDSVTEQLIQESLQIAMQNRTVLVIAHRLSTILSMDKIFVMDKGRIVESGTHQELLDADGYYKRLWDTQSGHSII